MGDLHVFMYLFHQGVDAFLCNEVPVPPAPDTRFFSFKKRRKRKMAGKSQCMEYGSGNQQPWAGEHLQTAHFPWYAIKRAASLCFSENFGVNEDPNATMQNNRPPLLAQAEGLSMCPKALLRS